jgi:hypothetical protein
VGLSIAFNPVDETIEKHADVVVKSQDLRSILPYVLHEQHSGNGGRKKCDDASIAEKDLPTKVS